jgi:hypothetical protein
MTFKGANQNPAKLLGISICVPVNMQNSRNDSESAGPNVHTTDIKQQQVNVGTSKIQSGL